jgi:hypothetical protein
MRAQSVPHEPVNLAEWFEANFGEVLVSTYFRPYNEKIWNVPLEQLAMSWADRIPKPPLEDVIRGALGELSENHRSVLVMRELEGLSYREIGEQLGMSTETRYEVLSMDAHKGWNWNRGEAKGNSYATTSRDLSRALRRNPHLKVFVGSGRYDLGTPYSATDWSLAQLDVPADVLARVEHHYYDAGHMMYTREEDLTQLKLDLAAWLA